MNVQSETKNDNIITSLRTSRMTHGIRYCHARNKTLSGNPKSVAQRKCVICRFHENPIVIDPRPGDVFNGAASARSLNDGPKEEIVTGSTYPTLIVIHTGYLS